MEDHLERKVLAAVRRHADEGRLPAAAATMGLVAADYARWRSEAGLPFDATAATVAASEPPPRHLDDLVALLVSRRSGEGPWTRLMAGCIASAAFGARHLWQDLGAAGRPEVTALLQRHFPSVVDSNVRQFKWKHHLFLLLGAELGVPDLRPPRCDGCDEQAVCFPDARAAGSRIGLAVVRSPT